VKGETKYSVDITKQNFLGTKDRFSTVGAKVSTNFTQDYFLTPIEKDKEYPMPTVLYELAKWNLLINANGPVPVNSADSLNYLLNILQENPTYIVQLESHTDSRDTNEANKILSQKRSQTCVDYLISKGIEAGRLVAKGMGEEVPREIKAGDRISPELFEEFTIGTTLTEEYINSLTTNEAKERAHQLNRRTTFRIIGFDYVPKTK
jgi:peptidoglycan-associated lipoprotein